MNLLFYPILNMTRCFDAASCLCLTLTYDSVPFHYPKVLLSQQNRFFLFRLSLVES